MANWAKLQEQLTGLPVVKRAKHSIHFDKGNGEIVANFSGKPCHYEENGEWKPIDTKLLLGNDGFYGCPHSPVKVHKDGRVKVDKSNYSQFTELPGSPVGKVDGDRIVRDFPGGYQELFVTEEGFREVITVIKPTFPLEKFIGKQTGTLPSAYKSSPQTAVDANGDMFEITSDTKAFGNWLNKAAYPVTIDPDFTGNADDHTVYGSNADYATARSTSAGIDITGSSKLSVGQALGFLILRGFLKFDTSSISPNTVSQVNLKLVCIQDCSQRNFDIQIVKQDWSAQDPIATANREAVYDNCLSGDADASIWRNTNGMSINTQYASGNLATEWVNTSAATYYSLRGSLDVAGSAPTANNEDYVGIASANNATESYRPVLSVTYTTGGALLRVNMNGNMQSLSGGFHG